MSKPIVIDIETTGLDWKTDRIHGVGICTEEDETEYHFLNGHTISIGEDHIGHNFRFDLKFLLKLRKSQIPNRFWDTKLLAQLIDENQPLGLKPLWIKYLGDWALDDKGEMDRLCAELKVKHIGELCRFDLDNPDPRISDIISRYCQEDCNNTFRLSVILGKKLRQISEKIQKLRLSEETPLDYYLKEAMPMERVLLDMEFRGIRVNRARIDAFSKEKEDENRKIMAEIGDNCRDQISKIEEQLLIVAREKRKTEKGKAKVIISSSKYKTLFNMQSPQHIGQLFYRQLDCPPELVRKTAKGHYKTDEPTLIELSKTLPPDTALGGILSQYGRYRKNLKLLTTYTGGEKGLIKHIHTDGRVYPEYNQAGRGKESNKGAIHTGRISAHNPPIQTLPRGRGVRGFFIPDTDEHLFFYADYKQIEFMIAAHLSQDPEMLKMFRAGEDPHRMTAMSLFGKEPEKEERQVGKTINFATIFDASPWRLSSELQANGLDYSPDDCKILKAGFFEKYSRYAQYLKEQKRDMRKWRAVISEAGRVRRLPDLALGDHIDWRGRRYTGPTLLDKGTGYPLLGDEAFTQAKKRFSHAIKQGLNHPIQSLGATITKRSMVELHKKGYDIVTQTHDSLILQIHRDDISDDMIEDIRKTMVETYRLSIPLSIDWKLLKSFDEEETYDNR